jgi:hypothetical protein
VVVALRHLAPQGEELAALGHPHEHALDAERAELVRDRTVCEVTARWTGDFDAHG